MKKLFNLFLLATLFCGFTSCSDDNDDNRIKFYVAESYNADGTANLVRTESLSAKIGMGTTFYIKGGSGNYTVTSDNEGLAVVQAGEESGLYHIATNETLGSTTIKVKDGSNETVSIPLSVQSYRLEFPIGNIYTAIQVEEGVTIDENIKKEIEEEVATRMIPVRNLLVLTFEKPSSGSLYISGDGTTQYTGTFTQTRTNSENWFVDAKYNDKEFHYHISKIELVLRSKEKTFLDILDILEDMTEVYKEKYPDAGIKKVYAVMESNYNYVP